MRQLLRKDVKFQWTKECDRELQYLKEALTKPPILRPIDPRLPIYLQVDGSKMGYGAAILQRDVHGNFYVIQYGAKATNPAQQQYNSDDLECLALIYSLKLIEPIAINKEIIVITDNSHLLHLNTWTPINARQKGMIAYLMQFNLTISYVKGSRNVTADCLSPLFTDASPKEHLRNAPATIRDEEEFLFAVTTRSAARRQVQTDDVQTAPDGIGPSTDRGRRDYADDETVNGAADDSQELGPLTDLYEDADDRLSSDARNDKLITVRTITGTDYENDEEFKYLFKYLTTGELSEDDKINKTTLLMSDQYLLEDDVLYRIEIPRKKHCGDAFPIERVLVATYLLSAEAFAALQVRSSQ